MKLAQSTVTDIFGKISPPPGPPGLNQVDTVSGLSRLFSFAINVVFFVAAITALIVLFWGMLDWITSDGDKEKLNRARNKIANALIGILITCIILSIYLMFTSDLLGFVKRTPDGGFQIKLPTLEKRQNGSGGSDENAIE